MKMFDPTYWGAAACGLALASGGPALAAPVSVTGITTTQTLLPGGGDAGADADIITLDTATAGGLTVTLATDGLLAATVPAVDGSGADTESDGDLNTRNAVAGSNASERAFLDFGGTAGVTATTLTDNNGADPNFFLFEIAGNNLNPDNFTVSAILGLTGGPIENFDPAGSGPGIITGLIVGQPVDISAVLDAGNTGVITTNDPAAGSDGVNGTFFGAAFSITDLLDENGDPLTAGSTVYGFLTSQSGADFAEVFATGVNVTEFPVPEPSSLALAAAGLSILTARKRRRD